ncbi:hypothetical protein NAK51_004519 [Salmonella enterica]|nr:hypothetical protein [Salmonella enterica]EBI1925725.1 hypothetical protein [Salmonella enterica]EHM1734145.1 hypothetical protein [Salmonella enterica]EHO1659323.1 hypothetical protein [Salmonella enterica]EJG7455334.1 hypothetical protein [Salmonella enterica]
MRLTNRKKEILSYFEPDNRDWVTSEVGAPPFDVSGITRFLYKPHTYKERHYLESTRRTLEAMIRDGLLEKSFSYERCQKEKHAGSHGGVWCNASRYDLPVKLVAACDDERKKVAL